MNQDKQFEKLAFRIKLKRWVITILLIIILFPIMTAVGYKITQSFSARQSSGLMKEMEIQQDLMSPNIQNSDLVIGNSNIGGGTVVSHQYKDIDGYHLPWQTVEGKRTTQTKIPLFYNNRVKSPNVSKAYEVKKISQMKNYVGEVALTFRHPMTYSQILQKLPKGIQANWFWLGVNGKADPTIEDNCFLGIQSFNGKLGPNDYKGFRKSLQSAKNLGTYNSFSITDYAHGFAKKYPTLNQARFSGIIITGKTENFKPLVNQNWITESSVGATIKRVPYIKPSF